MAIIRLETLEARRIELKKAESEIEFSQELDLRRQRAEEEGQQEGIGQGRAECRDQLARVLDGLLQEIDKAVDAIESEVRVATALAVTQILGDLPLETAIRRAAAEALKKLGLAQGAKLHVHPALAEHFGADKFSAQDKVTIMSDGVLRREDAVLETALGRFHIGPLFQAEIIHVAAKGDNTI